MLQMLQSDDDRRPDEDDEVNYDWEFGKVIEKDRPVNKETAEAVNESSAQTATDKSIKTGKKKQETAPKSSSADLMRFVSLGTELAAAVFIGTFLGWAFNRITGYQGPWALVVGMVIGSIAGFLNMYRVITEEEQKEEQHKRGSSK
ncbi:MAG: AtpZ/AtpI family protein [Candidatus Aquicultor sp.]